MSIIKIKAKDSVLESDYEFETYPESAIQSFDNSTPIDKYKEAWRIYKKEVIDSIPHIEVSEKEKMKKRKAPFWTAPQKLDRKNLIFGVFLLWN